MRNLQAQDERPKILSVKVRRVKPDKSLERDNKAWLVSQTEFGAFIGYHIVHLEYWESNDENEDPVAAIAEGTTESSINITYLTSEEGTLSHT